MSLNLKQPRALLLNDVKYILKTNLLGYLEEVRLHLQQPLIKKYTPHTRFIVFSSGRSGSTLLISLLNTHPKISCDGEILKNKVFNPAKMIDLCASRCPKPIWGFKLLSYQLRNVQTTINDKRQFLEAATKQGYRLLYLERENRLNQAFSLLYAMHRQKWHQNHNQTLKPKPIRVDKNYLTYLLNELDTINSFERQLLEGLPYHAIQYERDLEEISNRATAMNLVFDYLQLEATPSATQLKKITPKDHSQFIENFEEVKAFLQTTPYNRFLINQ